MVYRYDEAEGKLVFDDELLGKEKGIEGALAAADFSGSGWLGFAAMGADSEEKKLSGFKNSTEGSENTPPGIPYTIGVEVNSETVVLSWSVPADDKTPSESLSYVLRVGSSSGAVDIVGEGSTDAHRYYHKLLGPISPGKTEAVLYNLPPGSYYWAVRAVDSGYQMSDWSDEDRFDF
jgi:hypothetical protein